MSEKGERFRMCVFLLFARLDTMSVLSRKKKNTELERHKRLQREKDQKKKQIRDQLPAKHAKGENQRS
jgi:hypothetical protein